MSQSALLKPFDLSDLSVKNRIVMAPMTRSRAGLDRIPNSLMARYYSQRASAGLILTEATVISKQAIGWNQSPGIYNDEQVEGWKLTVDALHQTDTPVFLQLWHCGRASHSDFSEDGSLPVAPSAVVRRDESVPATTCALVIQSPSPTENPLPDCTIEQASPWIFTDEDASACSCSAVIGLPSGGSGSSGVGRRFVNNCGRPAVVSPFVALFTCWRERLPGPIRGWRLFSIQRCPPFSVAVC